MFNGTTIYSDKITKQSWDFQLNSLEIQATSICLEIFGANGKRVVYNTTNACHQMAFNRLITPIPFQQSSTQIQPNTIYYFSILLTLEIAQSSTWSVETCAQLTQIYQDGLLPHVSYIPVLGAQSLGSPGLLLSAPAWRKEMFGSSYFSLMFYPNIVDRVKLTHVFVNGMLSDVGPAKKATIGMQLDRNAQNAQNAQNDLRITNHNNNSKDNDISDQNEHTCYVNQIPVRMQLVYQQDTERVQLLQQLGQNGSYITHNNIKSINRESATQTDDGPKYYYPLMTFPDEIIFYQNRTTLLICPTIDVIGKYVDPTVAGLAYLGSITLVSTPIGKDIDLKAGNQLQFRQPVHSNNRPLQKQIDQTSQQLQQSGDEKPQCQDKNVIEMNSTINDNDECSDAAMTPMYGYLGKGYYLTTMPFLTFGSNKNTTFPLLSVKVNPVSQFDTNAFAVIIVDLRGFEVSKSDNGTKNRLNNNNDDNTLEQPQQLQQNLDINLIPTVSDTTLTTFFSSPPLQILYKQQHSTTHNNNNLTYDNDEDDGPSIKCIYNGYRLDKVHLNVTSITLKGEKSLVHSNVYLGSQLSGGLPLSTLNMTYMHPETRFQITVQALRMTDLNLSERIVELSCTLNSGYGLTTNSFIAHAPILSHIADRIHFPVKIVQTKQQTKQISSSSTAPTITLTPPTTNLNYIRHSSTDNNNNDTPTTNHNTLSTLPQLYATFNFSLIHLNSTIIDGFRLTFYGHHTFDMNSLNECRI
jgi:hypothetical protein